MAEAVSVDPVTLAVVRGRLEALTDEMDATLYRAAFCPVIAEGHDACHGIYDARTGETLVQGKMGLPIFVATMQFVVQALLGAAGRWGIHPGDVFFSNDPYIGGTHVQDFRFVRPLFLGNEVSPFCYLASCGHHVDVGGAVPGGFNPSATEYFQEGILLPLVKLIDRGEMNQPVLDIILANSRVPEMVYGDINAQLNALRVGEVRVRELCAEYGDDVIASCFEELKARAEGMVRAHIRKMPNGIYSFEDFMDNDGITDEPLRVAVDVHVREDELGFDFSRSDMAGAGPTNASRVTTVASVYTAIKHLFPDVPPNGGVFRALRFVIPSGRVVSAERPTPVGGYLEVSLRVIGAVFGSMQDVVPELTYGGPYGTTNCMAIGGRREDGSYFVMFAYFGGGMGGSVRTDGLNHGNTPIAGAMMQPVEILEASYPVLFREFALREGSFGPGWHRGGLGARYEIELRAEAGSVSILGDRGRFAPFGILGGGPAALNRIEFDLKGEKVVPAMTSKATGVNLARGDRINIHTPGGGGYGDPGERDSSLIAYDMRNGYTK